MLSLKTYVSPGMICNHYSGSPRELCSATHDMQGKLALHLLVPAHALHGLLLLVLLHWAKVADRAPREGAARVVPWRPHWLSIALHIRGQCFMPWY